MSACEPCWNEAYRQSRLLGGSQVDHYQTLLSVMSHPHGEVADLCQPCADQARCDRCNERMCSDFGPEPRACGTTCADCPCACTACLLEREDMRAELERQIERDAS